MKKLLLISVLAISQFVSAGSEGVGGGDPDAVDYLLTTKTLIHWIGNSKFGLSVSEKKQLEKTFMQLSNGMNQQDLTPIRFVNHSLVDMSGTSKIAIYSKTPFSVTVNREQWKNLSQQDKLTVAGLEIFGLANINDRYNLASQIKNSMSTLSELHSDTQLLNFIIGSWSLVDGSCLSGGPVNWGDDSHDNKSFLENYKLNFQFNSDLTFKNELLFKSTLIASQKGAFAVKNANLNITSIESCRYDTGEKPCENELVNETTGLLTIQKNQIWILSNQGHLGGSCEPQDVFIMKYIRL